MNGPITITPDIREGLFQNQPKVVQGVIKCDKLVVASGARIVPDDEKRPPPDDEEKHATKKNGGSHQNPPQLIVTSNIVRKIIHMVF